MVNVGKYRCRFDGKASGILRVVEGGYMEPKQRINSKVTKLVVEPTHVENLGQIGSFAPGRGENKKYLKPPPSYIG